MIGGAYSVLGERQILSCRHGSSILARNNTRQGYVRKDTLKLAGFLFLGRADAV